MDQNLKLCIGISALCFEELFSIRYVSKDNVRGYDCIVREQLFSN